MSTPDPTVLLTAADVAIRWSCSERYVYEVAQRGRLASVRFGRRMVRYDLRDVELFEAKHTEGKR